MLVGFFVDFLILYGKKSFDFCGRIIAFEISENFDLLKSQQFTKMWENVYSF